MFLGQTKTGFFVCAAFALLTAFGAQAETPLKTTQSSGLSASLVDVIANTHEITAQLVLTNNTKVRIYLTDARVDNSQLAFLGSGLHLGFPTPAGLPFCNDIVVGCISNAHEMAIEKFSYIEPGDSLAISMKFGVQAPFPDKETISFSVALVTKSAKQDADPSDVGPAKALRFSFPFVSFTKR